MNVTDQRWRARVRHERKTLLMALLGLLTATEFLEGLMFVFAASYTVRGIGTNARGLAQIQAAYAIGSMLMIVLQQWLSQRWGYRRYLCASLVLFMLGTLGCAASQGLWGLSAARLLQGFGGGAFFTSSRILVNTSFKPAERPRAVKYFMLSIFAGSAVAPAWAALLLSVGNWRWVFLGGLPLAAVSLVGCWRLLPEGERLRQDESYPGTPLILFALAVVGLQLVLAQVHEGFFEHPWRLLGGLGVALALLVGFVWQQYHHPRPLLRVRELDSSVYKAGLGLYFLHYLLSNFSGFLFPVLAERGMGLSLPAVGGLNSAAGVIALVIGYLYVKWARLLTRKKPLMLAGACSMVATALWLAFVPAHVSMGWLLPALAFKGLFAVLLVMPVAGLTFRELGDARFAHGYQGKNLMRQVASSLSTAMAAVLLQERERSMGGLGGMEVPETGGGNAVLMQACQELYLVLAALALLTVLVVWRQRRLD